MSCNLSTQNSLLLKNLMKFYNTNGNMERILPIINGEALISLRLIDWFATNYSKKNYTVYNLLNVILYESYINQYSKLLY